MVEGGTLTDESFDKLQQYMNDIKGEAGQHAFLVLETENAEQRTGFDDEDKPKITVQNLASILQKDELFQEYLENNRRRVQSAFQLPDLYVGYTTDFNRATAQMAMEVTEEQVFQPERKSLAWAINHRLLNDYKFKYVEVYFKEPDLTNPDDIYKLMSVANNAGGITPNDARQILYNQLGMKSQDFDGDWAEVPVSVANKGSLDAGMTNLLSQVNGQVEKAQQNHEPDEVVAVMKEVRKVLTQIQKQEGKANED
jgi:capsid portal protein